MIPVSPNVIVDVQNPDGSGSLIITRSWTGTLTATNSRPLSSVRVQNTSGSAVRATFLIGGVSTFSGTAAAGFDHTFPSGVLAGATTATSLELDNATWG